MVYIHLAIEFSLGMKDRTCYYTEVAESVRREREVRRNILIDRLVEYKRNNPYIRMPVTHGSVSMSYAVISNYLERRVCVYGYTVQCSWCSREIYFCGVNCKLCGVWGCIDCTGTYDGVSVCGRCRSVIEEREKRWTGDGLEVNKKYKVLKELLREPSDKNINGLTDLMRSIEGIQLKDTAEDRIKKNLLIRVKIALCEWYIYKAREERYYILIEQLEYLEVLRERDPSYSEPIERAIEEVLREIGEEDSYRVIK